METYRVYMGVWRNTLKIAGTEKKSRDIKWMAWAGSTYKGRLHHQIYIIPMEGSFSEKLEELAEDVREHAQGRTIDLQFPPFEFKKEEPDFHGYHDELEFYFAKARLAGTQKPTDAEIKQIQEALGIKTEAE